MSTINLIKLAKATREMRKNRGIRAAAKEIGVGPATLSRVERGLEPSLTNFARLVSWLNMSADEFIVREREVIDVGRILQFPIHLIAKDKDLTRFDLGEGLWVYQLVRRYTQKGYWTDPGSKSIREKYTLMRDEIWPEIAKVVGLSFGDPDYEWTTDAAFLLADEWNEER